MVVVYSADYCSYCVRARQLLDAKGVSYDVIYVDRDVVARERMLQLSQRRSVPQILLGITMSAVSTNYARSKLAASLMFYCSAEVSGYRACCLGAHQTILRKVIMSDAVPANAPSESPEEGQFTIQKIYVKDVSFEAPNSPQVFLEQWTPELNLQLSSSASPQGGDMHEVVLTLVVTAKQGEKTLYLIEVQQAGVFNIQGFNEQTMVVMLGSYCPNILFPYGREVISDLVAKGGFPQLLLAPVNFDALFAAYSGAANQSDALDLVTWLASLLLQHEWLGKINPPSRYSAPVRGVRRLR